ncbi:DNA sulfur modification protein DndB [Tropicimonas marinistellae]|uniref:DNA sulfur modification protein DndB n=1 Tax=Tropicimonas marinistellae TaxID=1739787 RepID=UPI0008315A22|nr:DNA sulfur modification protein DndB [Tropicimonas marinistellae]
MTSETMPRAGDITLDEIKEMEALERKQAQTLSRLLDNALQKDGHAIVLRGVMGSTLADTGANVGVPSYTAVHTLRYVSDPVKIKMGSEMPFLRNYIDDEGQVQVDKGNAADLAQRAPDWTRQPALTAYLLHDKNHKFGTILAVVSPAWVDDPKHENWSSDGRALKSAVEFEALDSSGNMGLIDLRHVDTYALDGQHRIMGIRGIQALQEGRLDFRKKGGAPTGKYTTREEFLDAFKVEEARLKSTLDEQISVEYIPAVIKGETASQAKQRVRSVFVAINSYAKRTDKGENILLDESNGFALVGRHAGLSHPLFEAPKEKSRVNWKTSSLPKRSVWITTLQALKDMTENYLSSVAPDLAKSWEPKFKGQVPLRPSEQELKSGQELFEEFLDHLKRLPVFRRVDSLEDIDAMRLFDPDEPNGEGHLLLRPIGQTILARAVGDLVAGGMSLDQIFEKLRRMDSDGGFNQQLPSNVWYGVTFDPAGRKMIMSNQNLAAKLLVYMIRGGDQAEQSALMDGAPDTKGKGVRVLRANDDQSMWRNFEGKLVPMEDNSYGSSLPVPVK